MKKMTSQTKTNTLYCKRRVNIIAHLTYSKDTKTGILKKYSSSYFGSLFTIALVNRKTKNKNSNSSEEKFVDTYDYICTKKSCRVAPKF